MRVLKFVLLFIFLSASESLLANTIFHTVREGETLGSILENHELKPLWGDKGWVKKAIALNPSLIESSGALLIPGQILTFTQDDPNPSLAGPIREVSAIETVTRESEATLNIAPILETSVTTLEVIDKTTRSKASLYSGLNYGAGIRFSLVTTDSRFSTGISTKKISFKDAFSKRLKDNDQFFSRIFFSYERKLNSRLVLSFDTNYVQVPHLHAESTQVIAVKSLWVPTIGLSSKFNLLKYSNSDIYAKAKVSYLGESTSSSDSLESGYSYGFGPGFKYFFKNSNALSTEVFYQKYNQDSVLTNRELTEASMAINYEFNF